MKRENIVVALDIESFIAKNIGKAVAHVKAVGPLACTDSNKLNRIWDFYFDKLPNQVYDTLKSFGEIYCFFDSSQELVNEMEDWFPSYSLIVDDEYDELDMDYYVSVVAVDEVGNDILGV